MGHNTRRWQQDRAGTWPRELRFGRQPCSLAPDRRALTQQPWLTGPDTGTRRISIPASLPPDPPSPCRGHHHHPAGIITVTHHDHHPIPITTVPPSLSLPSPHPCHHHLPCHSHHHRITVTIAPSLSPPSPHHCHRCPVTVTITPSLSPSPPSPCHHHQLPVTVPITPSPSPPSTPSPPHHRSFPISHQCPPHHLGQYDPLHLAFQLSTTAPHPQSTMMRT